MRFSNAELKQAQAFMDNLSLHGFKPGELKSKSTQSYTKAMTAKFLKTVAQLNGDSSIMIANCESYDAARCRSSDLFGILDLIAVTPFQTRGIQACGADWQPHISKLREDFYLSRCDRWLSSPSRTLELWGWTKHKRFLKNGKRGRQHFWVPRCQLISIEFLKGYEDPVFVDFWPKGG